MCWFRLVGLRVVGEGVGESDDWLLNDGLVGKETGALPLTFLSFSTFSPFLLFSAFSTGGGLESRIACVGIESATRCNARCHEKTLSYVTLSTRNDAMGTAQDCRTGKKDRR